ncbi:MAG: nucleotidyltransferase domain-containing protein [Candidatus Aenigmarchaeota archaeon]|nr:nucleotidyltransferase domain-containing protein [Candidatus Aenigmarchaeota archaeon]
MDKKAIVELNKFKKEVKKKITIEKMIFFGSRIGKRYHEDSDIDLIIVSKEFRGINFFKRVSRMYDFWRLNYPVDFLCYTPREFNKLKKEVSIVSEALREGIEI